MRALGRLTDTGQASIGIGVEDEHDMRASGADWQSKATRGRKRAQLCRPEIPAHKQAVTERLALMIAFIIIDRPRNVERLAKRQHTHRRDLDASPRFQRDPSYSRVPSCASYLAYALAFDVGYTHTNLSPSLNTFV